MSSDPLTGKLVGMLAHDLRTPLSGLLLHLELLKGADGLSAEGREDAAFALAGARELTELLGVAVDAIRGVEAQPADHDLAALLRQAAALDDSAGTSRAVDVRAPDTLTAHVDGSLTRRAILQLLASAKRVTPADRPVRARLQVRGSRARLEIVDEGQRIPEELRDLLLDPAGAVAMREGHRSLSRGFGPVFCRRVAEAHGCGARVEPDPDGPSGRGNVIWIELPLGDGEGAP